MFKVYKLPEYHWPDGKIAEGYQIFWCPSAPMHYQDRVPHDGTVYKQKQAAYRKMSKLRKELKEKQNGVT